MTDFPVIRGPRIERYGWAFIVPASPQADQPSAAGRTDGVRAPDQSPMTGRDSNELVPGLVLQPACEVAFHDLA